jgi:hypothetical protein
MYYIYGYHSSFGLREAQTGVAYRLRAKGWGSSGANSAFPLLAIRMNFHSIHSNNS